MSDETAAQPHADTTVEDGPARFVGKANGFLTFKVGLKSNATTEIDEAIKIPSEQVERAFVNNWDRHVNVEVNRNHDILRRQAYELSFGDDERKRIRDSLPADMDVLDVIECFGKYILLENFTRYLAKRRLYFRRLSFFAPLVSLAIAAATVWGVIAAFPQLLDYFDLKEWLATTATAPPKQITLQQILAPGLLVGVTFAVAAALVTRLLWEVWIAGELKTERTYYIEVIKGSTSRVKSYLSSIQTSFVSLSVSAQKQLTDIKKRDDDFVGKAKKYVRLIVWFPVRLEMIEVFYRATIDSYMEISAKEVLAADHGIFARRQLRLATIATAILTTVCAVFAGTGNSTVAAVAPLGAAVLGFALVMWPRGERWSSSRFIPKDFSAFPFDVSRRRGWGVLIGSLPAALGSLFLLSNAGDARHAPDFAALWMSPWPAVVLLNTALICIAWLQNIIAWQIYLRRETRTLYNGNVADTIIQEMDSADWGAFNALRSDQRMADIYESVFSALQEERKARR